MLLVGTLFVLLPKSASAGWVTTTCSDISTSASGSDWSASGGYINFDTGTCVSGYPGSTVPRLNLSVFFNRALPNVYFRSISTYPSTTELVGTIVSESVTGGASYSPVGSDRNYIVSVPGSYNYSLELSKGFRLSYTITFAGSNSNASITYSNIAIGINDTVAPSITSLDRDTPSSIQTEADTLRWKVKFDEDVVNVDASDFSLSGTTAGLSVSGSSDTYYITASGGDLASLTGQVTVSLAGANNIQDRGANALNASSTSSSYSVDNTTLVTNVRSSASDGYYRTGTIPIAIEFQRAVTVVGSPQLLLETGLVDRVATYTSGSGTSTLVFSYTISSGDVASDLAYNSTSALSLNGGSLTDTNSLAPILTLASPGASGSLSESSAIVIDTTAPSVTDASISLSGATDASGAFKVGDTVTASWVTSPVTDGDTNITGSLGGVTVNFSAFGGGSAVAASLSGATWTASYTIVANTSTSGSNLNVSVTATDEAGNATTTADTSNATVDAVPPVVTAANISLSGATGTGGAFKIGDTVEATWNNIGGGDNNGDIASVSFDFTEFGGGAAVAATNSSGTWTATYTITAGSIDATNRNVTVTATDTAGNSTFQADTADVTVDNVAPALTAGAIAVSGQTGNPSNSIFKIGDTVTVSWDNTAGGDNNADTISSVTVDFSDFGGGAAVAASNSSGTWTATFLYADGATAGSTYGVATTITDNAGNVTTTNDDQQLSLDNVETPDPSGVLLDTADNTGSTSDALTSETKPTIGGTAQANATIDIFVNGTVVGQTTADGSGVWSYTFVSNLAEGANSITSTATDAVGNTSEASAAYVVTIDTTPPSQPAAPALEAASDTGVTSDLLTFDTTPELSGSAEANSAVEIFVGGVSKGTVQADVNGDWSFTLLDGSLSQGSNAITVTSTDAAGNASSASSALTIVLDTVLPTIAITDPLMGDNLFNAAEANAVTLSGTTTDVDDGQTVMLSVSDGTTTLPFTTTVSSNAWTTTIALSSLSDGALTVSADVTDVAGNAATQASHTIAQDSVLPTVTVSGPEEIVTAAFDVTIEFSEVVTGLELSEVAVVNGTAIELTGSGTTYVARIDPVMGQTVEVSLAAGVAVDGSGNPNSLSNVYQVLAGSPASEFEKYSEEIRQVLVDEAQRSLRSTMSANQNLVRGARQRVMEAQRKAQACLDQAVQGDAVRPLAEDQDCIDIADQSNHVPFDVDGTAQVSGSSMMTSGSFFEQSGDGVETTRRLFFGDFDIQHDGESGSTTATLNARIAWEDTISDQTMFGYFVGGSLANSNIAGAFDGTNTKVGVDAGVYAVHQLDDALHLDGFATLGIGQNNLEMANDVLALESEYTTKTAMIGASLSGVIMENGLELHPELAVSYGKTWLGDVGFMGRAYGLTDDTLSLDAGSVALGNMTLRTELIVPLDGATVADSNTQFSFSPRLICEYVKTTTSSDYCGGGAEIGLSSASDDGLSTADIKLIMDRIDNGTRSSVQFGLEHKF